MDIMQPLPIDIVKWRQEIDDRIANNEYQIKEIPLKDILTAGSTQSRSQLDQITLDRYANLWKQNAKFPPVVLFHDDVKYRLVDGYHRYYSKQTAFDKSSSIKSIIVPGSVNDAILYSLGVNAAHGLPRKDSDINYSVITFLGHAEWIKYSNVQSGIMCGCSESLVRRIKQELTEAKNEFDIKDIALKRGLNAQDVRTAYDNLIVHNRDSGGMVVTKTGKVLDTSNIGKVKEPPKTQWLYVGVGVEGLSTGEVCEIKRIAIENAAKVYVTTQTNPRPTLILRSHLILADSSDETIRQGLIDCCQFAAGEKVCVSKGENWAGDPSSATPTTIGDLYTVKDLIPSVDPASQMWQLKLRLTNGCGNTFDDEPSNYTLSVAGDVCSTEVPETSNPNLLANKSQEFWDVVPDLQECDPPSSLFEIPAVEPKEVELSELQQSLHRETPTMLCVYIIAMSQLGDCVLTYTKKNGYKYEKLQDSIGQGNLVMSQMRSVIQNIADKEGGVVKKMVITLED